MLDTFFVKILLSLPIIFLVLYFLPILGVFLLIAKYFFEPSYKKKKLFLPFICFGLLLLLPKGLEKLFEVFHISLEQVPLLVKIISFSLYKEKLVSYGMFLLAIGIFGLVLHFLLKKIINNFSYALKKGFKSLQKQELEISRENDLKIKEKQLRAKQSVYVKCPYCGSDNILGEKYGVCMFCRRKIENKKIN